jgi:hypothetical protein
MLFTGMSFSPSGKLWAHVEKTYFLKGQVGQRAIAIKMLCYDEMPDRYMHYFFADDKMDRYLVGRFIDKYWHFVPVEKDKNGNLKAGGTLKIAEAADGQWRGTWTDTTGKSLDIDLKPILPISVPSSFSYLPYVSELDPYESYRLSNIDFIKTKTQNITKDLVSDWYLEKQSGLSFFRLRSNNKKLITDSINAALETINLSLVQKYFAYNPGITAAKVETRILYLTNELVSVQLLSKNTYRNGDTAQSRQLMTLDVASGLQVSLEDLVWFDKGEEVPPSTDLFKIYKYRKNVFAPKVFGLLQELYPGKMKSDSCDINKMDTWALPAWSLTKTGIALGLMTPEDCDVLAWAILPFNKLEPFMGKRYHLMPASR